MSTPTPVTPKAPRSARRHQKRADTTNQSANSSQTASYNSSLTPQTPPSSPPDSSSAEVATDTTLPNNAGNGASRKKNGRSAKKNKNSASAKASPIPNGIPNGVPGHRHTTSQPSVVSPSGPKDNPHYAGPTFHASPAPSALPMPSFFSKSVPDGDAVGSELEGDLPELYPAETTPSKPRNNQVSEEKIPEESPLDFLFKAAREARTVNGTGSPQTKPEKLSPPFSDKKPSWQDHSDGGPGGVFPLELDGSDAQTPLIGPSFATPYKDRMNALRSASSPCRSPSNPGLEEEQRKAKTEALKTLLLNPRPQRPASASPQLRDQRSMFSPGSSISPSRSQTTLARQTSPSPNQAPIDGPDGKPLGIFDSRGKSNAAHQYLSSVCNNPQKPRTPSSTLRQEISPSSPTSRADLTSSKSMGSVRAPLTQANTFINAAPPMGHHSPAPYWQTTSTSAEPSLPHQFSPSPKSMDTTRMEDDLRRILKLDITGGINSNGVQSPVA
ncbi:hypothetical protein FQN54_007435 [Arachnomyces sp. PD_36]|nr:hypothetical protein FQN54_007435 [Arachnomyces sp. PD_36]